MMIITYIFTVIIMKKYISVLLSFIIIVLSLIYCKIQQVSSDSIYENSFPIIIIDAGHGGVDGGATSCTGALESQINLEISLRLNDLCHLLGMETKMIRTTDISVYTEGQTISQKKVSDLKHRVQIINETPNATVISIHQNYFSDGKYSGAQVFYPKDEASRQLAEAMQLAFAVTGSTRSVKPSQGVYLMEHIRCPGVLVECGFLSNPQEEAKLRSPEYQKLLCCVIVSTLSTAGNA
jgi:N-acetylmuramoyl-L-alanine amidase